MILLTTVLQFYLSSMRDVEPRMLHTELRRPVAIPARKSGYSSRRPAHAGVTSSAPRGTKNEPRTVPATDMHACGQCSQRHDLSPATRTSSLLSPVRLLLPSTPLLRPITPPSEAHPARIKTSTAVHIARGIRLLYSVSISDVDAHTVHSDKHPAPGEPATKRRQSRGQHVRGERTQ